MSAAPESAVVETDSPEATEALGEALARLLPPGAVAALHGNLAAGKTCLVRGAARCFGAEHAVHSPTFTLVNAYGAGPVLHHLDLYRLGAAEEALDLGIEELLDMPEGCCMIEWAERAEALLPAQRVDVLLEHLGGGRRRITVSDRGVLPSGWAARLQAVMDGPRTENA